MQQVIYITLEQVLVIHQDQIDRYGGSSGLRELSLLESAVFRPQTTFSGEDLYKSHFDKAAALLHSLVLNHAFIDGNKRTGTVASIVYLKLNGISLAIQESELVEKIALIEKEKWGIEKISQWLEEKEVKR